MPSPFARLFDQRGDEEIMRSLCFLALVWRAVFADVLVDDVAANRGRLFRREAGSKAGDQVQLKASLVSGALTIMDGAAMIANEGGDIFQSTESWAKIGKFKPGDIMIAAGPPEEADGYLMVPLKPKGAVQYGVHGFAMLGVIMDGATLVANQDAAIFNSIQSWKKIGDVPAAGLVIASGPPEEVDGYIMVPVKPSGAVQFGKHGFSIQAQAAAASLPPRRMPNMQMFQTMPAWQGGPAMPPLFRPPVMGAMPGAPPQAFQQNQFMHGPAAPMAMSDMGARHQIPAHPAKPAQLKDPAHTREIHGPQPVGSELEKQINQLFETGKIREHMVQRTTSLAKAATADPQTGIENAVDVANLCPDCAKFERTGQVFLGLENVAAAQSGGVPFGSGSRQGFCNRPGPGEGTGFGGGGARCFSNINDGISGDESSWQPGTMSYVANKFVGVRFNKMKWIAGFGMSIPQHDLPVNGVPTLSKAEAIDSVASKFVVQVTTREKVNHMSSQALWKTVGSFDRQEQGTMYFRFNTTKPLLATALRVVVDSPMAALDELEVFGTDSLMPTHPKDVTAYSNVASKEEGGTPFASGSREGFCSKPSASEGDDACGQGEHCFCAINDGKYADSGSWMPNRYPGAHASVGNKKFIGIRFDAPKWVAGFRISSQGNGSSLCCTNNWKGQYEVQVAAANDVSYDSADEVWTSLGSFDMTSAGSHYFKFGWPVSTPVSSLRILVSNIESAIDELEIYGGEPLQRLIGKPPQNLFSTDVARGDWGSVAFASGSYGCTKTGFGEGVHEGHHCFSRINDGWHGNESSWMPGDSKVEGNQFVGIRFPQLAMITGFSLSSPGKAPSSPSASSCFKGLHKAQITTDAASATGDTLNGAWSTLGAFTRQHKGYEEKLEDLGAEDRSKVFTKHYFKLVAPVVAKALRIVVDSPSVCIDEMEVFGDEYEPPGNYGMV